MRVYKFPDCGCYFPVIGDAIDESGLPLIDIDYNNINLDCKKTWSILGKGFTAGIFQLESSLGKNWTKRMKPEDIEHICALGAILRPGCLEAKDENNVSMTEHYCRRKNKEEEVLSYHPSVDEILFKTYNVLCYQEQAIKLAVKIAGFNEQEADSLRRAIGKKKPEEMALNKIKFLEGAKKLNIISESQAEEVFSWIEKSQRYSFNRSHSFRYGLTGYWCAFVKAHFPLQFYTYWLYHANKKADAFEEISKLVNEAKLFDIQVLPPNLTDFQANFFNKQNKIYYGLSNVKGIGEKSVDKILSVLKTNEIKLREMSWYEFLNNISLSIGSSALCNLIKVGALPYKNISRQQMLEEFRIFFELKDNERTWLKISSIPKGSREFIHESLKQEFGNNLKKYKKITSKINEVEYSKNLIDGLKVLDGFAANKNRRSFIYSLIKLLENPPSSLIDNPLWISLQEKNLLGVSLTCSKLDISDTSNVDTFCRDLIEGKTGLCIIGVEIISIRTAKIKNGSNAGKDMAYLNVSDNSGEMDSVVVFSDVYEANKDNLKPGMMVLLSGEKDRKRDGFIVKKVEML